MSAGEFDFVVIGAGSSGAAVAARLGEDESSTTCVLEAGGPDSHPFIHIPELRCRRDRARGDQLAFRHRSAGGHGGTRNSRPARAGGRRIGLDQRHGLLPRPPDRLRRLGGCGLHRLVLLPKCCPISPGPSITRISPRACSTASRGRSTSSWSRTPTRSITPSWMRWASLQFPACPDFNGPNPEGYGRRQGLIRDGRRESTATNMLRPALARGNVHLQTDARGRRGCSSRMAAPPAWNWSMGKVDPRAPRSGAFGAARCRRRRS